MTLQNYLDNMAEASTKALKMLIERSNDSVQVTAARMTIASRNTPANLKLLDYHDEELDDAQAEWEFDQQNKNFWGVD